MNKNQKINLINQQIEKLSDNLVNARNEQSAREYSALLTFKVEELKKLLGDK
jgi:hypothetical protein